MIERGATNVGDVKFEGKIRVKFNTKITSMGRGENRRATKGNGRIKNFGSLLLGSDKKIFSLRWVDSEAIQSKPRVYSIKSGGQNGEFSGRIRAGERNIKLGVISIQMKRDRRIDKKI